MRFLLSKASLLAGSGLCMPIFSQISHAFQFTGLWLNTPDGKYYRSTPDKSNFSLAKIFGYL
jgi:hypothetical protein